MDLLHILTFTGLLGIALCYKCHVSSDSASLGCGALKNMTCSSVQYTPYCHLIPGDTNSNGICTCEKFCLGNSACAKSCPNANEHRVCVTTINNLRCLSSLLGRELSDRNKFCLDDTDCAKGCPNANEHYVCAAAYPSSLERICLCKPISNPVG